MNQERKRVTDIPTYQRFTEILRDRIEARGFVTPQIEEYLHALDQKASSFSEHNQAEIRNLTVQLSHTADNHLQHLYVVGNVLKNFYFPPEECEIIGNNTATFLETAYQTLGQDEESIDARMVGWAVLQEVAPTTSTPFKQRISQLAAQVGSLDQESDYIKTQAIQMSILLAEE